MSENKKHRFIGLCLTRIQEYLESELFHAVAKRAHGTGYKLLVFNAFDDFYYSNEKYAKGERYIFDLIPYEKLDGLIILSETIKDEKILHSIVNKAHEHDLFTVCIDKRVDGCYNIEYNYRGAFETIVRHIIKEHGCKTINVVAGFKDNSFSDERIFCCRRVMAEFGLELDPGRIMYGNFWSEPTEKAFDEFMLSGLEMPDAFICCNDSMAMTVCSKLKDYGYSVPGDVIVTGFDGIIEEQYHIPRLTTARQNVELAGYKAVDAIVSYNEGKDTDYFCIIDHTVIFSHSCGCKPIDYREATGQITPLFQRNSEDMSYDTYMFEFNSAASLPRNMDEFSEMILANNTVYGYYYFTLCLDSSFMNVSFSDEKLNEDEKSESPDKKLILCENYDHFHYPPYYADAPLHLEQAFDLNNIFIYWSVHFQDKYMGYGVMGISLGLDDLIANDDVRHLIKYTRNLNQVLENAHNQYALKKYIAQLKELYIRDHITGLYNRRGFYTEIQQCIKKAQDDKEKTYYLIILSVDMDGLKFINDSYGHAEGDAAIKATADALKSVKTENVICSRFGGDEFTVAAMCDHEPEAYSKEAVSKIEEYLTGFNAESGKPYKVKCSCGYMYDTITEDFVVDNLIKAADDLMYKEKMTHRESRARSVSRAVAAADDE